MEEGKPPCSCVLDQSVSGTVLQLFGYTFLIYSSTKKSISNVGFSKGMFKHFLKKCFLTIKTCEQDADAPIVSREMSVKS